MSSAERCAETMPPSLAPSRRASERWLRWPVLVAACLAVHFACSVGLWMLWLYRYSANHHLASFWQELRFQGSRCVPAVLLLLLSVLCLVAAIRGREAAHRLLWILVLASMAFFALDVIFNRCQIVVGIATREYWESGGRRDFYFTWWWYDGLRPWRSSLAAVGCAIWILVVLRGAEKVFRRWVLPR